MIKKLTFIIILSFIIASCSMQNSFKLKIDSYEYVITANNINDTFKAIIDNNTYDMTPLIYASFSGNLPLAKFSIENGADINAKNNNGETSLMWASYNGYFEVVQYLVDKGANINNKDKDGDTALIVASRNGYLETVKYLVEKGADIDAKDNNGVTSLTHASNNGHSEVVKYLVEFENHINSLYDAIGENNPKKIIDIANNYKVDLNNILFKDIESVFGTMETIPLDMTPLIYAIHCGNIEAIDTLLRLGANVGQLTDIHFTYFTGGLISITPLMYAAASDSTGEIISFLIKKGAKVNAKNRDGKTALMYSCPYRYEPSNYANIDSAKALINAGADVNAKSRSGEIALIIASIRGYCEIVKCLAENGANYINDALIEASKSGKLGAVKCLVEHGADIDYKDNNGKTALMSALENEKLRIVAYFIEKCGDINAKYDYEYYISEGIEETEYDKEQIFGKYKGMTILMIASLLGKLETVKYLIKNGADVNIENYKCDTALDLTEKAYIDKEIKDEIIKALKEAGAI